MSGISFLGKLTERTGPKWTGFSWWLLNFFVGNGFDIRLGNLCHVLLEVVNIGLVGDEAGFDQTVVDTAFPQDIAVSQVGPVAKAVVGAVQANVLLDDLGEPLVAGRWVFLVDNDVTTMAGRSIQVEHDDRSLLVELVRALVMKQGVADQVLLRVVERDGAVLDFLRVFPQLRQHVLAQEGGFRRPVPARAGVAGTMTHYDQVVFLGLRLDLRLGGGLLGRLSGRFCSGSGLSLSDRRGTQSQWQQQH